ncbi:MAG: fibrobacter succinogenes major paralogous domain-containing protein [Sphingobacteriales bacterium]|nr:fibrobacter succinogenes major paralogous domain-containing protein [Sphingobacteriales bacterium]
MKTRILFLTALFISFLSHAQVSDKNGFAYETVKIGTQIWTAENLLTTTFQNGDPIPEAKNMEEWIKAGSEGKPMFVSWDKSSDEKAYGNLYNWYAITDKRGIAPKGWHVPTDKEWNILVSTLGSAQKATIKLKSIYDWEMLNLNINYGESGFEGLPAGIITSEGFYEDKGTFTYFWSSSEQESFGLNRNLSYDDSPFDSALGKKGNGLSVRLVKD